MTNLAERTSSAGAIHVSLDLDETTGILTITAQDRNTDETITHRTANGTQALRAYHHPWGYKPTLNEAAHKQLR